MPSLRSPRSPPPEAAVCRLALQDRETTQSTRELPRDRMIASGHFTRSPCTPPEPSAVLDVTESSTSEPRAATEGCDSVVPRGTHQSGGLACLGVFHVEHRRIGRRVLDSTSRSREDWSLAALPCPLLLEMV